jgi:hypothetical protein
MNEQLAFSIMVAVCLVVLARLFIPGPHILRYPVLAALVVLGWFGPQAFGLINDLTLPLEGFSTTMLYAALCVGSIVISDAAFSRARVQQVWVFDERRLLIGAGILTAIGNLSFSRIFTIDVELADGGGATGIATILYFFAQLQYFGLALALLCALRRPSIYALAIVGVNLFFIGGFILFGGRRGPAVDVAMIVLTLLWFERRVLMPRMILLATAIGASFLIYGAGIYRQAMSEIAQINPTGQGRLLRLDEIVALPWAETFKRVIGGEGLEAKNAIYSIAANLTTNTFDYGAALWNSLVFRYVPAQFLGADFKASLMIPVENVLQWAFNYKAVPGATFTGFADSFASFGWFGFVFFMIIAAIFATLWSRAMQGSTIARLYYAIFLATGMQSVTHGTFWFLPYIPQAVIFTIPFLLWARSGTLTLSEAPFSADSRGLRPLEAVR